MSKVTTVQVKKETLKKLKEKKEHPRQTYDSLIRKMIATFEKKKEKDKLEKLLFRAQQPKMRELWDNEEDEVWEDA